MRPTDTMITPRRLDMLKQIRDARSSGKDLPLHMDDLSAFARLRLVQFDQEGNLALTAQATRILAS